MKKDTAIELIKVTKRYQVKQEKPTFFESVLIKNKQVIFTALNQVSLKIRRGESVGIIGSNGAGKTTIIKVIAGITTPTSGKVFINGSIVSIIDLSAGFHPDLVGQDNVLLNGLLLGMTKSEVKQKMESIRAFADIGEHFLAPLYTYSSGMKLRLGFAIAIHANPNILLVDESIMAGDEEFQIKAREKLVELYKQKKTFVLVSHNLRYLKSTVNRVIWIEDGMIVKDGGHEVIDQYVLQLKP